jgi:hypothetical protein
VNKSIIPYAAGPFLAATLLLPSPGSAQDCEALEQLELDDTTIVSATEVAEGPFMPPAPIPPDPPQPPVETLAAHCRVIGEITPTPDSSIAFEVWLPVADDWNGKLMGIGNSGLSGGLNYTTPGTNLADALNRGYAATGTDTGHVSSQIDGSWAIGEPEKVIDHGYRALHATTLNAKAIIEAYYGNEASHAYSRRSAIPPTLTVSSPARRSTSTRTWLLRRSGSHSKHSPIRRATSRRASFRPFLRRCWPSVMGRMGSSTAWSTTRAGATSTQTRSVVRAAMKRRV